MGDQEELVERLEQLYCDKYQRFFRLALAIVGSREAADDAVHDAFVRALRGRRRLRDPDALEAWVWRTVLNVARTQSSDRRAGPAAGAHVELSELTANGHADEARELRAAVAALPERQRQVLFLRHYADLEYEQIAAVVGIARGTVAATLNQAHRALRKTIEVSR
jgi:RNA polymerase sigma factor (sigma-70 family)